MVARVHFLAVPALAFSLLLQLYSGFLPTEMFFPEATPHQLRPDSVFPAIQRLPATIPISTENPAPYGSEQVSSATSASVSAYFLALDRGGAEIATKLLSSPSGHEQTPDRPPLLIRPAPGYLDKRFSATGRYSPGHRGLDFVASLAAPVIAAAEGVVEFVGTVAGNLTVTVDHGNGWKTSYSYLGFVGVSKDQTVGRGEVIGVVGRLHGQDLYGVHFSLRRGDEYLDPTPHLLASRAYLLPPPPDDAEEDPPYRGDGGDAARVEGDRGAAFAQPNRSGSGNTGSGSELPRPGDIWRAPGNPGAQDSDGGHPGGGGAGRQDPGTQDSGVGPSGVVGGGDRVFATPSTTTNSRQPAPQTGYSRKEGVYSIGTTAAPWCWTTLGRCRDDSETIFAERLWAGIRFALQANRFGQVLADFALPGRDNFARIFRATQEVLRTAAQAGIEALAATASALSVPRAGAAAAAAAFLYGLAPAISERIRRSVFEPRELFQALRRHAKRRAYAFARNVLMQARLTLCATSLGRYVSEALQRWNVCGANESSKQFELPIEAIHGQQHGSTFGQQDKDRADKPVVGGPGTSGSTAARGDEPVFVVVGGLNSSLEGLRDPSGLGAALEARGHTVVYFSYAGHRRVDDSADSQTTRPARPSGIGGPADSDAALSRTGDDGGHAGADPPLPATVAIQSQPYRPEDTWQDLRLSAKRLRDLLNDVSAYEGRPVVVVAHSQGGIVARYALAGLVSERAAPDPGASALVTIATPNRGSSAASDLVVLGGDPGTRQVVSSFDPTLAAASQSVAVQQLQPDSRFMRELGTQAPPGVPTLSISASSDLVVSPGESYLEGAVNILLPAGSDGVRAHSQIAELPQTVEAVENFARGQVPCQDPMAAALYAAEGYVGTYVSEEIRTLAVTAVVGAGL